MSKRKALSVADKINILTDVDRGMQKKLVAEKHNIPPSTLSTIIKNRETILNCQEAGRGPEKKKLKQCKFGTIDEAMLKWVTMVRTQNLPVSGPLLKEKAIEYAKMLGLDDFQASSGWLDKFKKRHGITEKVVSGESASVSETTCDQWKQKLQSLLESYQPDDVFNMDECGLFYKCLPNKTLAFKDDKCFGGKNSKERITVVVCANMTGSEKMKLLVIGKSKQPRCFKGIKSLEVDYDYNKKSWMTSEIFEKWLKNFDKKMVRQNRKALVFVDNCPAHPPHIAQKLTNIKLAFFPPNTTSKLQPMDQGVIKNLKANYRKQILRRMIYAVENKQPIDKVIDLRVSITDLAKVWQNDVAESTIKNCFTKAGFAEKSTEEVEDDLTDLNLYWNELQSVKVINENINLSEYLTVDEEVIASDYPTDHEIIESVKHPEEDDQEDEEIDDVEVDEIVKPSKVEMLTAFETIKHGFRCLDGVPDNIFQMLNECEHIYDKLQTYVQQDIRKYLVKTQ